MTGRDVVSASLRLIGAMAPGESLAAQEATDGLSTLNRMLGSWSNESLLIHAIVRETPLTLTAGDGSYTLGASGDISTRPQRIEKALIRDETSSPAIEREIRILSIDEWAAIPAKDTQSTYPTSLYDDGAYPQRTISLYPIPSATHKLVLFTLRALTSISTLDTDVSLPPGYEEALIYNLALRLAPEYGRAVSDAVALVAGESKAGLKRANHRPRYLEVDGALRSRSRGFDYRTGDNR